MRNTIIIFLLFLASNSYATNYYVSSSGGNDSNNGLTTGTAWQTLSKVNATTFSPGDSVLFKKGDIWRETLTIPSAGTSSSYIVFSNYGTGTNPQFLGSKQATGWTNYSGNVWVSSTTLSDPTYGAPKNGSTYGTGYNWPGGSWFVDGSGNVTWGHQEKDSINQLASEYDWTWSAGNVYIYSPTNPTTRYAAMEVSQIQNGIVWNNKNYVTINGIDLHYQQNTGTTANYPPTNSDGLIIRNCTIGYIGIKGGAACGIQARYSDAIIQNNIIHDCGRRSISLNDGGATGYPILTQNVLIDGNVLYNGNHTTGVDISESISGSVTRAIEISNNTIYDSPTMITTGTEGFPTNLIFVSEQSYYISGGGTVSNVKIHNNILKYVSLRAIHIDNVDSCYIYNNTIYGTNSLITSYGYGMEFDNSKCHATVENNIFYGSASHLTNTGAIAYYKSSGATSVISDYNIFYQNDASENLLSWNGTVYLPSQFSTYQSAKSQDAHSSVSNPLLNSDMTLKTGSPAIGTGINVGYGTDIGAIPYATVTPPVANAGPNQIIYLPATSTTMSGTVTPASGHTATYLWSTISGGGTPVFSDITILNPVITALTIGSHVFRLTATQDDSQTGYANVTVTVNSSTIQILSHPVKQIYINR